MARALEYLASPDTLRVVTLTLLCWSWFAVVLSLVEEKWTRNQRAGYAHSLTALKWICRLEVVGLAWFTWTYVARAASGWEGTGGAALRFTFLNYCVQYAISMVPAVALLYYVHRAQLTNGRRAERERQIREAKARTQAKRRSST